MSGFDRFSEAKRRLVNEYDAAQERGELRKAGNPNSSGREELPGPAEIGLSYKQIHEARQIRDAEEAQRWYAGRYAPPTRAWGAETSVEPPSYYVELGCVQIVSRARFLSCITIGLTPWMSLSFCSSSSVFPRFSG